jgi:hypothetical protein
VEVISFTPLPPYPRGNIPQYPQDRGRIGTRDDLEVVGKRKISYPSRKIEPRLHGRSACSSTRATVWWKMANIFGSYEVQERGIYENGKTWRGRKYLRKTNRHCPQRGFIFCLWLALCCFRERAAAADEHTSLSNKRALSLLKEFNFPNTIRILGNKYGIQQR